MTRLLVGDRCETADSHPWPLIYLGRRDGLRVFATHHGNLWVPPRRTRGTSGRVVWSAKDARRKAAMLKRHGRRVERQRGKRSRGAIDD